MCIYTYTHTHGWVKTDERDRDYLIRKFNIDSA